jgi:hypothetical protein
VVALVPHADVEHQLRLKAVRKELPVAGHRGEDVRLPGIGADELRVVEIRTGEKLPEKRPPTSGVISFISLIPRNGQRTFTSAASPFVGVSRCSNGFCGRWAR